MKYTLALLIVLAACGGDSITNVEPSTPFADCPTVQRANTSGVIHGALTEEDCTTNSRYTPSEFMHSKVDYYEIQLDSAMDLTLSLGSTDFDSFMIVWERDNRRYVTYDDESGLNHDARISGLFQAGTYVVGVTASTADERGQYTFSIK